MPAQSQVHIPFVPHTPEACQQNGMLPGKLEGSRSGRLLKTYSPPDSNPKKGVTMPVLLSRKFVGGGSVTVAGFLELYLSTISSTGRSRSVVPTVLIVVRSELLLGYSFVIFFSFQTNGNPSNYSPLIVTLLLAPQETLSPQDMLDPQATLPPQITLKPWLVVDPQTTELPQHTDVPLNKTWLPHTTDVPQATDVPHATD